MSQPRAALADFLRPRLKPPGFNEPAFLATFDRLLDAGGMARDVEAPVAAPAPVTPPTAAPAPPSGPLPVPVAMIDAALLKIACPENSLAELATWVEPIQRACVRWGIDTFREVAAFLGQGGHESSGFTKLEENLNYRAARLMEVWPNRFPTRAIANEYAHNPEKLANFTYANRMGNGPPESGDGWRHRGFGIFGLTGKRNQSAFAEDMGIPLDQVPAFIRTKEGAAMSGGWFWKENNLDRLAATPGVEDESRAINGGVNGLSDRRLRFDAVLAELLRRERAA